MEGSLAGHSDHSGAASGEDGTPDGTIKGLTFTLSRSGQEKRLTLDQPTFGCQAGPDPDLAADQFDAGQ
jgi:hypothetical protein